jgi:hypothetical protein
MGIVNCTVDHAQYGFNAILYRKIPPLHVHLCAEYRVQDSVCVVSVLQKH